MNGDSFGLKQSKRKSTPTSQAGPELPAMLLGAEGIGSVGNVGEEALGTAPSKALRTRKRLPFAPPHWSSFTPRLTDLSLLLL